MKRQTSALIIKLRYCMVFKAETLKQIQEKIVKYDVIIWKRQWKGPESHINKMFFKTTWPEKLERNSGRLNSERWGYTILTISNRIENYNFTVFRSNIWKNLFNCSWYLINFTWGSFSMTNATNEVIEKRVNIGEPIWKNLKDKVCLKGFFFRNIQKHLHKLFVVQKTNLNVHNFLFWKKLVHLNCSKNSKF